MKHMLSCLALLAAISGSFGADTVKWVKKPELTFDEKAKTWHATFELDSFADVEVAIVDPKTSTVVCHLAAGVLGPKAPPPLVGNSRAQKIAWDGKDDYGLPVRNPSEMAVRVRAGMGVQLDRILGGDPYAFFSSEIQHGNHNIWTIAGIDATADGSVYVLGTAGQQGPFTVRQFDADGNYIRTVFPFPGGTPAEKVSGWGINRLDDGNCVPALTFGQGSWPSYSQTAINFQRSGFGAGPVLLPTAATDTLTVIGSKKLELLTFRTDGSIDPDPKVHTAGNLVVNPPILNPTAWDNADLTRGAFYTCPTPDGKGFYLSGICRVDDKPFWRPGQVWKVDNATRTATPWFALPAEQVAAKYSKREISYTPLQGVATDGAGHVFVCDRLNNRVAVLTEDAKPVRDLAVTHPDDVAWDAESKALYVTTRFGRQGAPGDVQLLRFDSWAKDDKPALQMKLCVNDLVLNPRERTYLRIVGSGSKKRVWVGYKDLPVRIYREKGRELELVRDFYQSGQKLRFLAFRNLVADPATDTVYLASGANDIWKLRDWEKADFQSCLASADLPRKEAWGPTLRHIIAADVALDSRNRFLFTRQCSNERVYRWALDGEKHAIAPVGATGRPIFSDALVMNEWPACLYFDRGMWPSPDGGMLVLTGMPGKYLDVRLQYHPIDPQNGPGKSRVLLDTGPMCGGLRTDRHGAIYLGLRLPDDIPVPPAGFAKDWAYTKHMARIVKYAPTGAGGNLYPTPLEKPAKVYDVHYGHISLDSSHAGFSPRFGVDPYGRIVYPNTLTRSVALMDNAGNEILRFGTYGNIDDWRKLEGRWSEAKAIPLSWPGAVDATDKSIYVADHANVGILRLRKTWALEAAAPYAKEAMGR